MLTPNTVLQGRYRILRQLGQGGMGTVYEGIDERFESQVAIKETLFTDEALRKQFEREARLLNKLRHPAMTRVVDHFTEGNGQFLIMDFVPGEDLAQMLERQKHAFPVATALEWGDQLLDALKYLHSQTPPIIHRDIKPHNLKATDQGRVILLDFGLAKGSAEQMATVATSHSVVGYSPAYAPLEQMLKVGQHWFDMLTVNHAEQVAAIQNKGTDARSDLYGLGATLLHLLTDKIPPNAPTRALSVWSGHPDPVEALLFDRNIPPAVANVLRRAMALSLDERFPSAAEMQRALREASQAVASGTNREAEQPKTREPLSPASGYAPTVVVNKSPTETPIQTQTQQPGRLASTVVVRQPKWEPQQPPAQPFGAQPFGARPFAAYAQRKNYLPWIIGGVALVAIVVVVIILSVGSSKKSTSTSTDTAEGFSTPTEAAQAYIDAHRNRDPEALRRTLSKTVLAQINDGLLRQAIANVNLNNVETGDEQIVDAYNVIVYIRAPGGQLPLPLVKEDGGWKVNRLYTS